MIGYWEATDVSDGGGSEVHSNFHQLLLLRAKDDPTILNILQRRTRKYTDHHIQNELLQILALDHLRKIASRFESIYFALEADEVTDVSNMERLVVCLRWVDSKFEPHEDFISLYHVDDITAETIVTVLKDSA